MAENTKSPNSTIDPALCEMMPSPQSSAGATETSALVRDLVQPTTEQSANTDKMSLEVSNLRRTGTKLDLEVQLLQQQLADRHAWYKNPTFVVAILGLVVAVGGVFGQNYYARAQEERLRLQIDQQRFEIAQLHTQRETAELGIRRSQEDVDRLRREADAQSILLQGLRQQLLTAGESLSQSERRLADNETRLQVVTSDLANTQDRAKLLVQNFATVRDALRDLANDASPLASGGTKARVENIRALFSATVAEAIADPLWAEQDRLLAAAIIIGKRIDDEVLKSICVSSPVCIEWKLGVLSTVLFAQHSDGALLCEVAMAILDDNQNILGVSHYPELYLLKDRDGKRIFVMEPSDHEHLLVNCYKVSHIAANILRVDVEGNLQRHRTEFEPWDVSEEPPMNRFRHAVATLQRNPETRSGKGGWAARLRPEQGESPFAPK